MATKKTIRIGVSVGVAILGILLGVSYAFGELWFRTVVFNALKLGTPFWTLVFWAILIPLAVGIFLIAAGKSEMLRPERPYHGYNTSRERIDAAEAQYRADVASWERSGKQMTRVGIVLVVYAVVMLLPGTPKTPGMLLSKAIRNGHETKAALVETISVSKQPHPEYLRRANSVQAERLVDELSNDPAISETSDVQYSTANGEPAWCAGAYGRTDALGRRYTTSVVCVTDTKKIVRASWGDTLVPSLGGNWSTNLAKRIAEMHPGKQLAGEDLRFGVRDGKPFLVGALTQVVGGMHPHTVPGGVIHIDGNGSITYDSHATRGEYGVAVVPYAVARDLRSTLNHRAGYWCSQDGNVNKRKCLNKNTPYGDTSAEGDVNSANFSEFVLRRADGTIGMITALTFFGKGRNITAYFDVNVDEVVAGKMPTATLYEGVNEVSYRTLIQTLTPAYTADLTWLTEIDANGDTATASRIYEITPSKPGTMVLTIGTATNPQYIVEVQAGLSGETLDFTWCVYSDTEKQGEEPRKIECRGRADGEAAIGTLRGLNLGGNTETPNPNSTEQPEIVINTDYDLSKLSVDELRKLINDAATELAAR